MGTVHNNVWYSQAEARNARVEHNDIYGAGDPEQAFNVYGPGESESDFDYDDRLRHDRRYDSFA